MTDQPSKPDQPESNEAEADQLVAGIRWLDARDSSGLLGFKFRSDNPFIIQTVIKVHGQKRVVIIDHSKHMTGG